MPDPIPQDPSPWAEKLQRLKHASPFRAFTISTAGGWTTPVSHPDEIEITHDRLCVEVDGEVEWALIDLSWVVGIEIGAERASAPRYPRLATKLKNLQEAGPFGPLVLTLDGQAFRLEGSHEFLLSSDGRSVALRDGRGLAVIEVAEITDLAPG